MLTIASAAINDDFVFLEMIASIFISFSSDVNLLLLNEIHRQRMT